MAAVQGAISHVKWGAETGLELTINRRRGAGGPLRLRPSWTALAVMVATGAVDETGRLVDAGEIDHPISKYLGKREDKNVFWLSMEHDVFMIPGDVRKLQLAKAAIAGGLQTLLSVAGIAVADVDGFMLAGGFGSFLDQVSAATIGLFPKAFLPFARTMGNTAGRARPWRSARSGRGIRSRI